MNRRDIEEMRRRLDEPREEPALIVWAAGLIFAALAVILNFV